MTSARDILKTFDATHLPDLDTAVIGALELFETEPPRETIPIRSDRILVVGSGNALATGEILFRDMDAVFANESSLDQVLSQKTTVGEAVLISASGGKHAVPIAKKLVEQRIRTTLLTNNPHPAAAAHLKDGSVVVFPKNREPYTYNTSTYLGMILSQTQERAAAIREHIETQMAAIEKNDFTRFSAYTFIIPTEFNLISAMVRTKFDELFGPFVQGRIFTIEEIKHAKTVVTSPKECFIALGVSNAAFGLKENRIAVPIPDEAEYGTVLSIAYYIVGIMQKQYPPYFKNNIAEYAARMSELFSEKISPIVE